MIEDKPVVAVSHDNGTGASQWDGEVSGVRRASLVRFAWLSVAAAIATIALKSGAYLLTGSVGLFSDAAESLVNLVGALIALAMLTIAARPADEEHPYGHGKAEYFASGAEGTLILIAALSIVAAAVARIINPKPLEQLGPGLAVSIVASVINLAVARVLLKVGRRHNSITLEADAKHLMTDVWTSAGVIGGLAAVSLTGWQKLDPILAIAVAANIVWSGYQLVQRSISGLIDTALPAKSDRRFRRFLEHLNRTVSSSTPCEHGKQAPVGSSRYTSWSRVNGACSADTNSWNVSKRRSAVPSAT